MDQPLSPQQGAQNNLPQPTTPPEAPNIPAAPARPFEPAIQPRPLSVPTRRFSADNTALQPAAPAPAVPTAPAQPTPNEQPVLSTPEPLLPTPDTPAEPAQPPAEFQPELTVPAATPEQTTALPVAPIKPNPTPPPTPTGPQAIDAVTSAPTPPTAQARSQSNPFAAQPAAAQSTQALSSEAPQPTKAPVQPEKTPQQIIDTADANDRRRSLLSTLRGLVSFVVFIATVVIAAMLINQFIFQSYFVDGTSMTPTLQNNDRLIIDKVGKTFAGIQQKPYIPNRGEIVVLDSAILDQYGHDEQLIKRVIGLPGDTVLIRDGVVTIKNAERPDGFKVDEELGLNLGSTYSEAPMEIKVPDNEVFVMGDNRGPNGSFDSRSFGPIKNDKIQGRLVARIFPFNEIKIY